MSNPHPDETVVICVTPVGHQAKPVLDALNGLSKLGQIEERFGQKALDFVGSLYRKGSAELR